MVFVFMDDVCIPDAFGLFGSGSCFLSYSCDPDLSRAVLFQSPRRKAHNVIKRQIVELHINADGPGVRTITVYNYFFISDYGSLVSSFGRGSLTRSQVYGVGEFSLGGF